MKSNGITLVGPTFPNRFLLFMDNFFFFYFIKTENFAKKKEKTVTMLINCKNAYTLVLPSAMAHEWNLLNKIKQNQKYKLLNKNICVCVHLLNQLILNEARKIKNKSNFFYLLSTALFI